MSTMASSNDRRALTKTKDVEDESPVRVFLWVVPRTCSTVLTKCMSFVDNSSVWMEPYICCNLNEKMFNVEFKQDDPDIIRYRERTQPLLQSEEFQQITNDIKKRAAALSNVTDQSNFTYPWIQEQLSLDEPKKQVIFVKDQAFAIFGKEEYLPKVNFRHTFLIRHPREVFVSYRRTVAEFLNYGLIKEEDCNPVSDCPFLPTREFYKMQFQFFNYIKSNNDPDPIIIDAYDLLSDPKAILEKYFELLNIPFKESYLSWNGDLSDVQKTFRSSDFVLLSVADTHTLNVAYTSTKFNAPKKPRGVVEDDVHVTAEMETLIKDAMPYYEEMYSKRLVVDK